MHAIYIGGGQTINDILSVHIVLANCSRQCVPRIDS